MSDKVLSLIEQIRAEERAKILSELGKTTADLLEAKICRTCKNFLQHYILREKGHFTEVYCGHCIYPNLKSRKPDQSCVNWAPKEATNRKETDQPNPAA